MCDKNTAIQIMNEVVERAKAMPWGDSFVDAYLFGSYARGDYDDESDIDIFLAFEKSEEEISHINDAIIHIDSDVSLEHDITVSTVVRSANYFKKYANASPLFMNILSEGIRYAVHQ